MSCAPANREPTPTGSDSSTNSTGSDSSTGSTGYTPSPETLSHFIWRYRYFTEGNQSAPFHYKIIDHYLNGSDEDYIRCVKAFRGSAKSTNTCYLALHRVEDPDAHYTLIVSDTATQAESLVSDISDMIQDSKLPYKVIRDIRGEIELSYKGKRYFIVGKGAGASLRGIKRNRKRPDLIILDDIVNDRLVMNRLRVDRLNRWFFKSLLPSLAPKGRVFAVGTPLSQNDLFMMLTRLHPTIEIPVTQPDGSPSWPDRFPIEWIERKRFEYEKAGMLREYKQEFELVLTDPETRLFDMSKISYLEESWLRSKTPKHTWFLFCDLAFSEAESADYSAFVAVGVDSEGRWLVVPNQGRYKPSEAAGEILRIVSQLNVQEVFIEQGASYISVREHLDALMRDTQQWFPINEFKHQGRSKISRISALEPVVEQGLITIIDNGEPAEALTEQMELTTREGCFATHDDLVDALSQAALMASSLWGGSNTLPTREDYQQALEPQPNSYIM